MFRARASRMWQSTVSKDKADVVAVACPAVVGWDIGRLCVRIDLFSPLHTYIEVSLSHHICYEFLHYQVATLNRKFSSFPSVPGLCPT